MKAQLAILMILGLVGSVATAEVSERKPVTKIDFNGMIDANEKTRGELKKTIDEDVREAALQEQADKAKVVDFVDLEVGWEEGTPVVERPVSDRRYNSVDE